MKLTTQLPLLPTLRTQKALPPLPLFALLALCLGSGTTLHFYVEMKFYLSEGTYEHNVNYLPQCNVSFVGKNFLLPRVN